MKVTVLGAGLIGNAIVEDLARDEKFHVMAVDVDPVALARLGGSLPVETVVADLNEINPGKLVSDSELVVCAVPGAMGFKTIRAVIEAGVNLVDISFFPEDPFELDELAQANGVTVLVDCGVAPGLCNILAGHACGYLSEVETYSCYVGGLPVIRRRPFEYGAVFSPADVLEEYTRPVRMIVAGQEVVRPALSELEQVEFPGIGTLEAFNTDGLRTLRHTITAANMKEKTLRYPGHAAFIECLRTAGFLDRECIEVNGKQISPLAVSTRILTENWKMLPGEEDLTVMQVQVTGLSEDGTRRVAYSYDLLDRYDPITQTSSMARTTGYTCTAMVRLLATGLFRQPGICPPEWVGRDAECYAALMKELTWKRIQIQERVEESDLNGTTQT